MQETSDSHRNRTYIVKSQNIDYTKIENHRLERFCVVMKMKLKPFQYIPVQLSTSKYRIIVPIFDFPSSIKIKVKVSFKKLLQV